MKSSQKTASSWIGKALNRSRRPLSHCTSYNEIPHESIYVKRKGCGSRSRGNPESKGNGIAPQCVCARGSTLFANTRMALVLANLNAAPTRSYLPFITWRKENYIVEHSFKQKAEILMPSAVKISCNYTVIKQTYILHDLKIMIVKIFVFKY